MPLRLHTHYRVHVQGPKGCGCISLLHLDRIDDLGPLSVWARPSFQWQDAASLLHNAVPILNVQSGTLC